MNENPDFEQNYYSRTSERMNKIEHISIRLGKSLTSYDQCYFENINYYDLMVSV